MSHIAKKCSALAILFTLLLFVGCKASAPVESETNAGATSAPAEKAVVKGETQLADSEKIVEPDTQPATAAGRTPDPEKKESAPAAEQKQAEEKTSEPVQVAEAALEPVPAAAEPQPVEQSQPATQQALNPNDPRSVVYLGSDGKMAGTGDPNTVVSEAFKYGRGATAKSLTAPGLPKDKFGLIDWIAMVDQEIIKPIGSLKPGAMDIPPFDMNVVIESKGDFVNDVLFRHKTHTYWLSCEICHTGIFIMAKGKNNMTMQGITQGKWCGRCHGKVSFPLTDCTRCHSVPKDKKDVAAK